MPNPINLEFALGGASLHDAEDPNGSSRIARQRPAIFHPLIDGKLRP